MAEWALVEAVVASEVADSFVGAGVASLARQTVIELAHLLERLVCSLGALFRIFGVKVTIVAYWTILWLLFIVITIIAK